MKAYKELPYLPTKASKHYEVPLGAIFCRKQLRLNINPYGPLMTWLKFTSFTSLGISSFFHVLIVTYRHIPAVPKLFSNVSRLLALLALAKIKGGEKLHTNDWF